MATAVATKKPAAKPAYEVVAFGDMAIYAQGGMFLLPEGDYAVTFDVRIHAYTKKDNSKGKDMLGVMATFHPLAGGEAQEHFFSLGAKAIGSYMPDPDTGKRLVKIPGAPAVNLGGLTAWGIFLKSLYDCGLPAGVFTEEVDVLDGIWVHTQNQPAPPELKNLSARSATGEAAMNGGDQKNREPDMVCVVTEIKDDGKPWENTGGIPEAQEEAPAKPAAKTTAKPVAAKPTPAAKPAVKKAAPAVEEEPAGEDAVREAAMAAVTALLSDNAAGLPKLMLRTKTFAHVKANVDDDTAQSVIDTFFADDDALNGLVGELGYGVSGGKVVPQV